MENNNVTYKILLAVHTMNHQLLNNEQNLRFLYQVMRDQDTNTDFDPTLPDYRKEALRDFFVMINKSDECLFIEKMLLDAFIVNDYKFVNLELNRDFYIFHFTKQ